MSHLRAHMRRGGAIDARRYIERRGSKPSPVTDAANERRDQRGSDVRRRCRLGQVEHQRHVAMNALALQLHAHTRR
jgi:hypothetical protein